ncbi:hypothetical protein [Amycolatopsis circi]|uniref:hypothetical protein n=1 Tax=Amycolatopsis circi TaxID=871959 RepID=UPI000E222C09|nr:hypothetical protein [Amycolatopsis circi]
MPERNSWAVGSTDKPLISTEDARLAVSALLIPGANAVTARNGIRPAPGTPGRVHAAGTASGSIVVEPFQGAVRASRGIGSYLVSLDTAKTLDVLAVPADPANDRYDLVIAQQFDEFYLDAATRFDVRLVRGSASATPSDPVVDGSRDWFPLGRVRVTAGANKITDAMIDQLSPGWTVALGGLLPVGSVAERNALAAYPGQSVYRIDKGWSEVYDGAAWRVPGQVTAVALADITDPYPSQLVVLASTGRLYRWNGEKWLYAAMLNGATPGGDWTITTNQPTSNAPTLLTFPQINRPPGGITLAGGVFTIEEPGWWDLSLNLRYGIAVTDKYAMIGGSSAGNLWAKDSTAGGSNNVSASTSRWLDKGATFRCYGYSGTASAVTKESPGDLISGFTAVWRGP